MIGVFLQVEVSVQSVVNFFCVLMGLWGTYEVLKKIKGESDAEHARRQGWDYAAKVIKEKEAQWDKGLVDAEESRKAIANRFDVKLADLEDKIELFQNRNDDKNKELKEEIKLIIRSLKSIMDGLIEQGYEDTVKDAKDAVDDFLTGKV